MFKINNERNGKLFSSVSRPPFFFSFPFLSEKTVLVGPNGSEELRLQLWDTAGQERFRKSMVGHYYR